MTVLKYSLKGLMAMGLGLGLVLGHTVSAYPCSVDPTASASVRDHYHPIQIPVVKSSASLEPSDLALAVFGHAETAEGQFSESVEIVAQSNTQVVLLLTQLNLPDDSVRDVRYRIEMVPNPVEASQWQMVWVGQQYRCWPGRGGQRWSKQRCS